MKYCNSLVALFLIVATTVPMAQAANTVYWDIDGALTGSAGGATPSGTWDGANTFWNTDPLDGAGATVAAWVAGDNAVFSAAGDATGAFTVTVSGTQTLGNLTVQEGTITQSGGTLDFGTAAGVISFASSGAATSWTQSATSAFAGTGGITVNGTGNGGTLLLRNTNGFSKSGAGNQAYLTIGTGATVDFTTDAQLGAAPGANSNGTALTLNGGTLKFTGTSIASLNVNRNLNIGANGGTIDVNSTANTGFSLPSAQNGGLYLNGTGTLTKTGAGRFTINTSYTSGAGFTGKYKVLGGTLNVGGDLRFGPIPGGAVTDYFTLDGGALRTGSVAMTIAANRGITLGAGGGTFYSPGDTFGITYNGVIAGTSGGNFRVARTGPEGGTGSNNGIVSLGGANTYDGRTVIGGTGGTTNNITLQCLAANTIPSTSVVELTATGNIFSLNGFNQTIKAVAGTAGTVAVGTNTLTLNGTSGSETYASVFTASAGGKVTKTGGSTQILSGSSTGFNGEFVLNSGTLGVGNSNIFGNASNTSSVTINGGILSNTATNGRTIPSPIPVALNADFTADDSLFNTSAPGQILFNGPSTIRNSDRTITVNGQANFGLGGIVGEDVAGRNLIKAGAGTLAFQGNANTYTGTTTILGGQISLDGDGTIGNGAGTVFLSGGNLNASASHSGTGTGEVVLNPITMTTNAAITCSAAALTPIFEFGGVLTGGGNTLTLTFRDDAATATLYKPRFRGNFTFNSNIDMPTGTGGGAAIVQLESYNPTGTTQTYTGTISGTGKFNRSASIPGDSGTTVFTANNSYSGGTTLNDGTLLANNGTSGSATGTGTVAVNSGGRLGGNGSVSGLVTVNSFGVIGAGDPATNSGKGTLHTNGGLTINEGASLKFDLGAPGSSDLIDVTAGALALPATNTPATVVNLFDVGGLAVGTYTLIDYAGSYTGSLANLGTPTGPAGFNYALSDNVGATTIELLVSAIGATPGDFNGDTFVNAADYVTWRKDPAANPPAGGDTDGYMTFRKNFMPSPIASPGLEGPAAVPEPSSIALVALVGFGLLCGRRRSA